MTRGRAPHFGYSDILSWRIARRKGENPPAKGNFLCFPRRAQKEGAPRDALFCAFAYSNRSTALSASELFSLR